MVIYPVTCKFMAIYEDLSLPRFSKVMASYYAVGTAGIYFSESNLIVEKNFSNLLWHTGLASFGAAAAFTS